MSPVFRDQKPGESLNEFLTRVVEPHEEERESFGAGVDKVVHFLQTSVSEAPYTVAEVYKGGSQKKGTTVKGSSDIDLVVFLNGINSITDLQHHRRHMLQRIQKKIKELGWQEEHRPELTYPKKKKFGIGCRVGSHTVDILPAFDVVKKYGSLSGVLRAMEEFRIAQTCRRARCKVFAGMEFSASLSPLQVEFIKLLPAYVKGAIRLLKKWIQELRMSLQELNAEKPKKLIPSYCLELLAAYQWKTYRTESIDKLFCDVITMLTDCSTIQVAMDYKGQYDVSKFTRSRPHPYILDPVNPYNNTFLSRTSDFRILERKAKETLQKLPAC